MDVATAAGLFLALLTGSLCALFVWSTFSPPWLRLAAPWLVVASGYAGLGFILFAWLVLEGAWQIPDSQWQRVVSPDGTYSVLMPGTPRQEQQSEPMADGTLGLHKYLVFCRRRELYMLTRADVPPLLVKAIGGRQGLLRFARQRAQRHAPGTPMIETPITVNGWPGFDLEFQAPERRSVIRARIWATAAHTYEVLAAVPRKRAAAPDVQRFLESASSTR